MKIKAYFFKYIFPGVVLMLLFFSCATNKNSFENRAYHTVTSMYNVNFNGKEALIEGEREIAKKRKDNYTAVLPLYYYPPKEDLGAINPKMDRVIEKGSKSIYKHSMLIRGKEYVKTMDDAYMMMGKAYFHKQEFQQATRIFTYITKQYPNWGLAEEAQILNVRTAIRQGQYTRAQQLLEEAEVMIYPKKSKKLNLQYYGAVAELNLTDPAGEPEDAISALIEMLKLKPKKDMRLRINFILGQLYEQEGYTKEAQKHFLAVIRSTPPYEMEFNARMKLASNYDGSAASRALIVKELNKMLNEVKNEDFKDQIYYAFSELERIDDNKEEREKYLAQSVSAFVDNQYQRTLSSVTLAGLLFERDQYIQAQSYYDTALLTLPSDYTNRGEIIKKASFLKELVDNLNEITLQDSLQRIAKMSEGERKAWVKKMIDNYTEEERRLEREEAERMMLLQTTQSFANVNVNTSGSSKWYFYNPGSVSAGATEFYRRFGNRKLEDNWLISNKQQLSFEDMSNLNTGDLGDVEEYDEDGNLIVKRETDPKKDAYYTQDLPLTDSALAVSDALIKDAMYNAAIIYHDLLRDVERSNEMFEQLITRFPESDLVAPSLFLMYTNYKKVNNPKNEVYKNRILTDYPDSDYAKLIQDPDYYKKLQEKLNELENEYELAYNKLLNKEWEQTIQIVEKAIPLCEPNVELKSKMEYLRVIARGQLHNEDTLKTGLRYIIDKYPKTEIAGIATILLSTFGDVQLPGATTDSAQGDANLLSINSPFSYLPNEQHYVVVIANATQLSIADIKNDLTNFNRDFYALQKFNINSFYINKEEQMVTVSRFKNGELSLEYYQTLLSSEIFKDYLKQESIQVYCMSATNYTTYYNKVDQRSYYRPFFNKFYLNKE